MTVPVNILTAPDAAVLGVLAARVRVRRRERRLSLDQLSTRSGVSKGMLVQIERGGTNPSIATLCKVAAALGASVADLVDASGPSSAAMVAGPGPRRLWQGARGGSATLLIGSTGPDMLELWAWELKPGERYDAIAHPAGTQELLHVTHGRLELTVGTATCVIPAGRTASARTDRPHAYVCAGRRPVRFTMVVAEPRS